MDFFSNALGIGFGPGDFNLLQIGARSAAVSPQDPIEVLRVNGSFEDVARLTKATLVRTAGST